MEYYEIAVRKITEDGDIDPSWGQIAVMISNAADLKSWVHAAAQLVHATQTTQAQALGLSNDCMSAHPALNDELQRLIDRACSVIHWASRSFLTNT